MSILLNFLYSLRKFIDYDIDEYKRKGKNEEQYLEEIKEELVEKILKRSKNIIYIIINLDNLELKIERVENLEDRKELLRILNEILKKAIEINKKEGGRRIRGLDFYYHLEFEDPDPNIIKSIAKSLSEVLEDINLKAPLQKLGEEIIKKLKNETNLIKEFILNLETYVKINIGDKEEMIDSKNKKRKSKKEKKKSFIVIIEVKPENKNKKKILLIPDFLREEKNIKVRLLGKKYEK